MLAVGRLMNDAHDDNPDGTLMIVIILNLS